MVKPTHLFHMEQFAGLSRFVNIMCSILAIRDMWKPFNRIALARLALCGVGAVYHYHDDLKDASKILGINL